MAQPLAIGDRLKKTIGGFFGIGDILEGIDETLVDDIVIAFNAARKAVGSPAKLVAWAAFIKVCALATTQTQVDDKVAEVLETIVNGPLKELLAAILDRVIAQQKSGVVHAASVDMLSNEERDAFQAQGIDPSMVLTIVQLLLMFWGKFKK